MDGEIKVESANCTPVAQAREWFIPLMDWSGTGDCWSAGPMTAAMVEAEMWIRNTVTPVKQGRIARVVLPCKAVA